MSTKRILGAVLLTGVWAVGCTDAAPTTASEAAAPAAPTATASDNLLTDIFGTAHPTGERFAHKSAFIPIYSWDLGSAFILYGDTPTNLPIWPAAGDATKFGTFYIIPYPLGVDVKLQCYDYPKETCPDHGPVIAGGAVQLAPDVYGGGVLGHDHLSPPIWDPEFKIKLNPVLVLFTSKAAAAANHPTTRRQIDALVKSGKVVTYFLPQYSFVNLLVLPIVYQRADPWVCAAYTFCPAPN